MKVDFRSQGERQAFFTDPEWLPLIRPGLVVHVEEVEGDRPRTRTFTIGHIEVISSINTLRVEVFEKGL